MKNLLTILVFLAFATANAQYKPDIFQKQSMPTMEYTSLAGWHGGLQVNTAYQNIYPGIPATNVDYAVNVDYYSPKLKGAFGMNVFHSRLGTGTVLINNLELYYTHRIKAGDFTISPSASLSYRQLSVDWNMITYGDRIHEQIGWINPDSPVPYSQTNKLIFNLGSSLTYKSLYSAFQLSNINQPDYSFFPSSEARLGMRYSGIIGWSKKFNDWNFNPSVEFISTGRFNHLSMSLSASFKKVNAGIKYRLNDQVGFAIGYDFARKVRLAYTYGLISTNQNTQSMNCHYISVRLRLLKDDRAEHRLLNDLGIL